MGMMDSDIGLKIAGIIQGNLVTQSRQRLLHCTTCSWMTLMISDLILPKIWLKVARQATFVLRGSKVLDIIDNAKIEGKINCIFNYVQHFIAPQHNCSMTRYLMVS